MNLNELAEQLYMLLGRIKNATPIPRPPTQLGKVAKAAVDKEFAMNVINIVLSLEIVPEIENLPAGNDLLNAKEIALTENLSRLAEVADLVIRASQYIHQNFGVTY